MYIPKLGERLDYDCFYASVFEAENPALRSLPLAVQQKQIVVTCNYEARRRGLRKMQLIKEAKKVCPDVVIVPGEDLTKFRDASKEIYSFLSGFVSGWGGRVERLGFDEVFLDVTSLINYNIELLNYNDLSRSFFHLDKTDPTLGFAYDACAVSGPSYPSSHQSPNRHSPDGSAPCATSDSQTHPCSPPSGTINTKNPHAHAPGNSLHQRLILGSHLASYIRHRLEEHKSYTATVGISTSKLLAKLAGNVHKPRNQTTLLPPYGSTNEDGDGDDDDDDEDDNDAQRSTITRFLDAHDISAVPGIGFKIAQKIRTHILGRQPSVGVYEELPRADYVTVRDVRLHPNMGPALLNEILLHSSSGAIGGSGTGGGGGGGALPKDIGMKIWGLINGIDPSPVAEARAVPTQISIEDSYGAGRLGGLEVVRGELVALARSLLRRMVVDLTEADEGDDDECPQSDPTTTTTTSTTAVSAGASHVIERRKGKTTKKKRWLAQPRTLRLSTRTRLPPLPDGTRDFSAGRVSKSCPMPIHIFSALLNNINNNINNNNHHQHHDNNNDGITGAIGSCVNSVDGVGGGGGGGITIDTLATRLVSETILPLFRRLHPEKSDTGKICVMNIAVTNMIIVAGMGEKGAEKGGAGRDIGRMFRSQERVLKEWRVEDRDGKGGDGGLGGGTINSTADEGVGSGDVDDVDAWDSDGEEEDILGNGNVMMTECATCGALMPQFAIRAHEVYHSVCS
ncbi:hypothetical protein AJ78_07248 [Emergomyces pasteurianus Ep9510]|uniref:UmuC domain-containing protein n=1 Tax=Emergomyces pasteurianus Ep9510 TaxID=1447872 RepID=A0A1J9PW37_9EURO|nr:hypothetical protein AJ78_07248 [Emergomyces pasteurianus Ep9510]